MPIHSGIKGSWILQAKNHPFLFVSQFVVSLKVVTRYGIRNLYKFLNFCNIITYSEVWQRSKSKEIMLFHQNNPWWVRIFDKIDNFLILVPLKNTYIKHCFKQKVFQIPSMILFYIQFGISFCTLKFRCWGIQIFASKD